MKNILKSIALVMMVVQVVFGAGFYNIAYAVAPVRLFTASISPTTSPTGTTQTYTVTVVNSNTSSEGIKSFTVAVPSGFVVTPSFSMSGNITPANWNTNLNGSTIEVSLSTGNASLAAGGYINLVFNAQAPATATTSTWTTHAYKNNSFSSGGGAEFSLSGNQPKVTVSVPDVPVTPSLSINSVSMSEGNSGTTNFIFTITLSASSANTVTVMAQTADGSATAGSDYTASSTTLTFNPGDTSKTFTVAVTGDTNVESNETFTVNLSSANNATISTAIGTGTIQNDDESNGGGDEEVPPKTVVPVISINNITKTEGNSGNTDFAFTISLSATTTSTVKVDVTSADGTAQAAMDYMAFPVTTVTFNPGEQTKQVSVNVFGDTAIESDETFTMNLTNPSNGTLGTSQGTGTIQNDDSQSEDTGSGSGSEDDQEPQPSNPTSSNRIAPLSATGSILGGQVLGASIDEGDEVINGCKPYLKTYIKFGKDNSIEDVVRLQVFLNDYLKLNPKLLITGIYDVATRDAVMTFQKQELTEVLSPWKIDAPTGYVYKTTKRRINNIMCPALNLPIPNLSN